MITISQAVSRHLPGNPDSKGEEFKSLAENLEYWYHSYKEFWRTVSRESELDNISDVIYWYADFLREL